MSPFKVATGGGGTRFSKGKIAGVVLMLLSAYSMLVPIVNHLTGLHLPSPTPDTGDAFTATLDNAYKFLAGLGIFGIRSAI